jgi:excisionase family DNA binding protein
MSTSADILTIQEAAGFLRVPLKTLYAWRSAGTGPRGFKVGRRTMFYRADLIRWLEEQWQAPDPRRSRTAA